MRYKTSKVTSKRDLRMMSKVSYFEIIEELHEIHRKKKSPAMISEISRNYCVTRVFPAYSGAANNVPPVPAGLAISCSTFRPLVSSIHVNG
jgi:hypothetical protein